MYIAQLHIDAPWSSIPRLSWIFDEGMNTDIATALLLVFDRLPTDLGRIVERLAQSDLRFKRRPLDFQTDVTPLLVAALRRLADQYEADPVCFIGGPDQTYHLVTQST